MKKLTKFRFGHVAMFIMAATLSFTACTKDEIEDDSTKDGEAAIPEFVSYTPEYAEIGVETDAMIMGKNFGTDASRITVMLGEKEMTVTEAGRSVIKFTVPETMEAGQYPLSVTVVYTDSEGVEQKASHTFEVDFEIRARVPEITGYKPAAGIYPGGELTIEGTDLGSDPALVTVTLGGEALEVKSVAPGAIVVTVPEDTAFGPYELKVDVKYGTGGSQTATKTFSDFNVLKREYVVTSEVWAGAGKQGAENGARLSAQFFAPQSLAFDDKTGALYVGEVYNGIRFINSSGNVSDYKAPEGKNPWWDGARITCLVSVEGDRLAYVVRNARERSWKYLWTASRTGGDFPEGQIEAGDLIAHYDLGRRRFPIDHDLGLPLDQGVLRDLLAHQDPAVVAVLVFQPVIAHAGEGDQVVFPFRQGEREFLGGGADRLFAHQLPGGTFVGEDLDGINQAEIARGPSLYGKAGELV